MDAMMPAGSIDPATSGDSPCTFGGLKVKARRRGKAMGASTTALGRDASALNSLVLSRALTDKDPFYAHDTPDDGLKAYSSWLATQVQPLPPGAV